MQNSPISWLGGKRLLRKTIIEKFPEHQCYVEVFGGGAWVLFGKEPSKSEILNDIDGELINFYQVVKCCPHELLLELQWDLISRDLFSIYKNDLKNSKHQTNVQKAKKFYYILKNSFGNFRNNFRYQTIKKPTLNLSEIDNVIFLTHERLKYVTVENLDYKDLICRYDRKHTLFYLDPPYRTPVAKKYHSYFKDEDFIQLNEVLRGIQGTFILSINDDLFIRELFKGFETEEVENTYTFQRGPAKKVKELLIFNF